jgi:hypothetical protein
LRTMLTENAPARGMYCVPLQRRLFLPANEGREMHTHDQSSWSPDSGDRSALHQFEELLQAENEQQEGIHRLVHQGMDEASAGHIEQAEASFSRALALAREHHYPRWQPH